MNRPALIIILAALVALLLTSIFIVDEREYAVKFRFGAIVKTDYEPGLHFKFPIVNTVRKFDDRILTLDMQPEQMNTKEQKYVDVDYFVKWRITDVSNFYTATQGDFQVASNRLLTIFSDGIRDEFAKRTLIEVVSEQRAEIMETLTTVAGARVENLGIEVVDVRIKQISLTARVTESVFDRMRTERREFANELRSLGRESSEQIRSDADRQRQVILAEARQESEMQRGQGDAESTEIYANAYEQDPEFYSFHRSLQAYRSAFGDDGDVLVLDPGSEFFDYFGRSTSRGDQ